MCLSSVFFLFKDDQLAGHGIEHQYQTTDVAAVLNADARFVFAGTVLNRFLTRGALPRHRTPQFTFVVPVATSPAAPIAHG
jgi:hypothetical protein